MHFLSLKLFALINISFILTATAAPKSYTISGTIEDQSTGEALIGASIYIDQLGTGTTTNAYGFYSLTLASGEYTLVFSFIGYASQSRQVNLRANLSFDVSLSPVSKILKEVVVKANRASENVKGVEIGVQKMDAKTIRQIPALMGEVDIIKAIQLLPGVQTTSEGSSGFSVRGGSPDQNLIQLDEATLYNASHLMGFFSVFNNDAIKDVKLYKGDIPPSAGGRLASLLDVRMKEGNSRTKHVKGGIGTISSRLTVEGPLKNEKISFMLSGRRTYADLFLKLSSNEDLKNNSLYFYDFNGKVNFTLDENNRLYLSSYWGRDVFKSNDFRVSWGNQTQTLRWNHLFTKKLFSNFTLVRSRFDYGLGIPEGQPQSFKWTSKLEDYSMKVDFGFYPNPDLTVSFGLQSSYHHFHPGTAMGIGDSSFFSEYATPANNALEHNIYAGIEQNIGSRLTVKYGLRFSLFQNVGYGVIYHFDSLYSTIDSTVYPRGKFFNHFTGLEPRLGLNYSLTETSSLKASFTRMKQFIHLASNSTSGTPLDIWFPSSPNVKPQTSDQLSFGYFRNFNHNLIETSAEVYYKYNRNAIDFKDHAQLLLNPELEGELRFGQAKAYGLELFVKYQGQRLSGWVSYTLSKSFREIKGINNDKMYRSQYDKPHNLTVVMNYEMSERLSLGANWVFVSGAPVTFPTGRAVIGNKVVPIYSDRNAYRMPTYHRLDLSLTIRPRQREGKRWYGEWNFSIYNAYARKNAWVINFVQDESDPNKTYAEKTYLFSVVPAITYNFNF